MKKFLSVILAVLMLAPLFVFSTTAAEQKECTYMRNNIAAKANASDTGVSGQVNHTLVIDGNRETGSYGDHNSKEFSYILEYDEDQYFDEILLVVNGKGSCPSSWANFEEVTNNNFIFEITMTNKAGQTVYTSDPDNPPTSIDRETYSTTEDGAWEPVYASKIEIKVQSNWAGGQCIIWEIEAYSGTYGKHVWEEIASNPSTCETQGYKEYTCACGETKTEKLPLTEAHIWDSGVVTTPAGDATEGVKTYTCTVCGEEREDKIPATVHNAFDAGVVTAPTCTEMGYTTYTCTHCGTYTYKGNYVNALGHDMDDGVMTVRPTFTTKGKMTYTCERYDDCGYSYDEDLAEVWYRDYETLIGIDDVTLTEEFVGTTEPFDSKSSMDKIFDGLIMTNTWGTNSDNYWKAPCGWVEDNDGDSSNNVAKGGKLIIDFKYEHYLTVAKFYIFANELGFTIKFYNGEDDLVFELAKSSFNANPANENPIVLQSEIIGQKVKKIVIESTNQHGKSPWVSEVEIFAHECLYDETDKTNVNFDAATCKQTFDGTCWICQQARVGVTRYLHTYTQINGVDQVTVDTPASCFEAGSGRKTCTVCEVEETVVIPATGLHDFDGGKEEIVTKNNCGVAGEAYKTCSTVGCPAKSEHYVLPATGNHGSNYIWKDLEGSQADYTHKGTQGYVCKVCGYQDESKGTKESPTKTIDGLITSKIAWWTIRYNDFISPRATFKVDKSKITPLDGEFTVKIFGVVKKGEQVKEVQVYGEGATGNMLKDGTFSLVVKGASVTDEFEFSTRVEITCVADNTVASYTIDARNLIAGDSTVSAYDVANYYMSNDSKANALNENVKKLYERILAAK